MNERMFVSYQAERREQLRKRQRLERYRMQLRPILHQLERIVYVVRTVLLMWLLLDWTYQIGVELGNFSLLSLVISYIFFKLTWPQASK